MATEERNRSRPGGGDHAAHNGRDHATHDALGSGSPHEPEPLSDLERGTVQRFSSAVSARPGTAPN